MKLMTIVAVTLAFVGLVYGLTTILAYLFISLLFTILGL